MVLTKITDENSHFFDILSPYGFFTGRVLAGKYAVGAVDETLNLPAGLLIFEILDHSPENITDKKPCFRLLWVCVKEDLRKKGTGRLLIEEFLRIAKKAGAVEVSADLTDMQDFDDTMAFFEHMGFTFRKFEELNLLTQVENLINPAEIRHFSSNKNAVSLAKIPSGQLKAFFRKCGTDHKSYAPDEENHFDKALSCAAIHDSAVTGVLLIRLSGLYEGFPEIDDMIFMALPDRAVEDIRSMLIFSLYTAMETYGPEVPVSFTTRDPMVSELIFSLSPDCPSDTLTVGIRKL